MEPYLRHENTFTDKTGPKGNVEFVIYEGKSSQAHSLIRTVIEVKEIVAGLTGSIDEAHIQLFAELIASYKHNLAVDPGYNGTVHGALTDAYNWVFARLHKSVVNEKETYHVEYFTHAVTLMVSSSTFRDAAHITTVECLQHIVYMLHYDLLARQGWTGPATVVQVQSLFSESDLGVKDNADQYTTGAFFQPVEVALELKAAKERVEMAERAVADAKERAERAREREERAREGEEREREREQNGQKPRQQGLKQKWRITRPSNQRHSIMYMSLNYLIQWYRL